MCATTTIRNFGQGAAGDRATTSTHTGSGGGGTTLRGSTGSAAGVSTRKKIRFQPWLALEADTGASEVVQPASRWLTGVNEEMYNIRAEVSYLTGCTLYLESSPTPEGPWAEITSFAGVTEAEISVVAESSASNFTNYIRWRVNGSAPWQTCFQLKAITGKCY